MYIIKRHHTDMEQWPEQDNIMDNLQMVASPTYLWQASVEMVKNLRSPPKTVLQKITQRQATKYLLSMEMVIVDTLPPISLSRLIDPLVGS